MKKIKLSNLKTFSWFLAVILLAFCLCQVAVKILFINQVDEIVKVPLVKRTLTEADYSNLFFIGEPINFRSPWGQEISVIEEEKWISYKFSPDVTVLIEHKYEDSFYNEMLFISLSKTEKYYLSKMIGRNLSSYEVRESALRATPEMFSYTNILQNWILFRLLDYKDWTLCYEARHGIFSFQTPNISGFQYGTLDTLGYVKLEIYTSQCRMILITISGTITQDEVDQFINSLGTD